MRRLLFSILARFLLAIIAFAPAAAVSSFPNNQLSAVASAASNDVWAVGTSSGASAAQGLSEHWNGASWTVVPSANPGATTYGFYGVAVRSATDVWAVGYSQATAGAAFLTLIEHWNGSQWSVIPSPSRNAHTNLLFGVTALSSTNVWAVGYSGDQNTVTYQTLIEHWDGTQWQIVSSPNSGVTTKLSGVSATSANDIWAVGWAKRSTRFGIYPVTEHWNGSTWSVGSNTGSAGGVEFQQGIAALTPNNAWFVGTISAEHWDGSSWSRVTVPNVYSIITGLAASSASDIWAVGREYISTSNTYTTLTEHWDGSQWGIVSSPSPGASFSALYGGAVVSGNDVWAVGTFADGSGDYQTLAEHWNGSSWSVVPTP
jgi:hypothetical protein